LYAFKFREAPDDLTYCQSLVTLRTERERILMHMHPRRRAAQARLDAALDALCAGEWDGDATAALDPELHELLAAAAEARVALAERPPPDADARMRRRVQEAAVKAQQRVLRVP
jgi:hypothetical protein